MVELVDTLDLGSSAARCGSSSLPARTKKDLNKLFESFFLYLIVKLFFRNIMYLYHQIGWVMYSKRKRNLKSGGSNIPVLELIVVVIVIIVLILVFAV